MKILQINSSANLGSTGRIAEQIGELILNEGWKSIIAYGRSYNESKSMLYRIGNDIDVKVHSFQSFVLGNHGFASIIATKKLISFIKTLNPDIIHLHNIHGYYINLKLLFNFLSKSGINVVWTLHDCWPLTGHCSYFSDIDCLKWKTECNNCPKKGNYPKSFFFDNSKRDFYLKRELFNSVKLNIVTVSNWLKNLTEQSFLNGHNIIAISNGVNSSQFIIKDKSQILINQYGLNNKKVLIAVSTSWAKQKGFDDYLKLSTLLPSDMIIVLIGLPKEYRKTLPQNILGIERTESIDELVDWYNIADIVLNLSIQESFGLTSVEGFMCGKPTILYNTTASPELILDSCMGEVVKAKNINLVKLSVNKILLSKTDKNKIRKIAIENFDSKVQFQKYIDLYKQLAN